MLSPTTSTTTPTVTPPPQPPTPPPATASPELPATGSYVLGVATTGTILIILGCFACLFVHRRYP